MGDDGEDTTVGISGNMVTQRCSRTYIHGAMPYQPGVDKPVCAPAMHLFRQLKARKSPFCPAWYAPNPSKPTKTKNVRDQLSTKRLQC